MDTAVPARRTRPTLVALAALALAFLAVYAVVPGSGSGNAYATETALLVANLVAGLVILRSVRAPDGWAPGRSRAGPGRPTCCSWSSGCSPCSPSAPSSGCTSVRRTASRSGRTSA